MDWTGEGEDRSRMDLTDKGAVKRFICRAGMKDASDYNRNIYLDILNFTRQDKELESRKLSLEAGSRQMTLVLFWLLLV